MNLKAVLKQLKFGELIPPQLKNNGAVSGNTYFDTLGLAALLALIHIGTTDVIVGSGDTSTAPYLEECDTVDGSYTAIEDAELAAVIGAGDDNKFFAVALDLAKSHKRYVRWHAPTAGSSTGANIQSVAIGFPADALPISAAEQGLAELVEA